MTVATLPRAVAMRHALGMDAPSRAERLSRALLAAAVIGCATFVVSAFVVAPLRGRFAGWFEDFGPLLRAGGALNAGRDPYADFVARSGHSLVTDLGFDYLPLVAWLARPLAAMPHDAAIFVWIGVTLTCTVTGAIIVARAVLPATWPRTALGFCVAVLFQPALYNVWHGQMNAVVFLCLALALRAWMREEESWCGVFLGLGAAAKVAPVVLLVLLVRRGWWRGALVGVGTVVASILAGGALVGFTRVQEWFADVLPVLGRDDGWYFNQGWNAVVNRLADHDVHALDPSMPALHLVVLVLSMAGLGAVVLCVKPAPATPERRALEFAAAVTAMLLAGTITWYSAYIHLTLPLLVVAGIAARRRRVDALVVAAGVSAAVVGVAAPMFLAGGGKDWVVAQYGSGLWWPALQLVSLPAFSAAALLVALLWALRWAPTGRAQATLPRVSSAWDEAP